MEAFYDKLIEILSDFHSISKPQATELLDRCIKEVAIISKSKTNVIRNKFATRGVEKCLIGLCNEIDLEECRKSCHCVIYEDKCVSRRIKDASLINKDPDKYVKTLNTKELEGLVKFASYMYYNYDGGGLNDNSFDSLEYNLNKRLKLKGRRYEKIGAEPIKKLRIELPINMPSLNKVKPGTKDFDNFIRDMPLTGIAWSVKLDGVSGLVSYIDGKINKIYTRGDGEIGGDVTYLRDYISLPDNITLGTAIVRGEFIIPKIVFHEKYSKLYSNSRTFVSAQINQGFISPFLKDIEFVAYDILKIGGENELPEPVQKYGLLELDNFKVVENGLLSNQPLAFEVIALYREKRESSPYNIDGIVLSYNIPTQVAGGLFNPLHSVAFKMLLEEQIRDTKVIDVEWNISRYGKYNPVAIYEAVYVNGVRLTRATAHNAGHIRDWNMGLGTKIKIVRGGDVIPVIKDVEIDKSVVPIFPGEEFLWHWSKEKFIVLDDIENNKYVQIERLIHFFSTIYVKGLGEKTIEKFWEDGLTTIKLIINTSPERFLQIRGIGKQKSKSLYENIHNSLQNTPLDRYMVAYTNFELGIGRKLIKQLLRVIPDLLTREISSEELLKKLWDIKKTKGLPGFGPKRIKETAEQVPIFREWLLSLNRKDITTAIENQLRRQEKLKRNGYNQDIMGKTFVLTGFLNRPDFELEDYIYDNMGDFITTVTSGVTAVICASLGNITDKMMQAHSFGIPVFTVKEFKERFDAVYQDYSQD